MVVIGLTSGVGVVAGVVAATVMSEVEYATRSLELAYVGASALLQAAASVLAGLAAWVLYALATRKRRASAGVVAALVGAVLAPFALGAIRSVQGRLPEHIAAFSPIGMGITALVLCGLLIVAFLGIRFLEAVGSATRRASHFYLRASIVGYALVAATIAVMVPTLVAGRSSFNPAHRNVLLISIDSVRKDTFEEYIGKHASRPLRTLFQKSKSFDRAFTTYSHSLPSHASMLTGRYPPEHGALMYATEDGSHLGSPVDPGVELMTERLNSAGYETVAILSNGWLGPPYGLEVGFDTYVNHDVARRIGFFNPMAALALSSIGYTILYVGERISPGLHPNTQLFLEWLRTRDQSRPFFAFLHYIEMHVPNQRIEEYSADFLTGPFANVGGFEMRDRVETGVYTEGEMAGVQEHLRALNLAAMARMDDLIKPVIETLLNDGWLESTLVILTSDHGDDFYEKTRRYGHSHVYNTASQIPLLIIAPGVVGGKEPGLVSLVDIPPTVYQFVGMDTGATLPGMDLLAGVQRSGPQDWIYIQGWDFENGGWARATLFSDGYKWMEDGAGDVELYNLSDDPAETEDLSGFSADLDGEYAGRFGAAVGAMKEVEVRTIDIDKLPEEVIEQLKALGYL